MKRRATYWGLPILALIISSQLLCVKDDWSYEEGQSKEYLFIARPVGAADAADVGENPAW